MSYLNGRVFIDTSTDPDTGISIWDIQKAVGRGTGDLGLLCSDKKWYDTGETDQQGKPIYALRDAGKINPYAKYKPVRYNSKTTPTDTQRKVINYGITPPVASSNAADTKNTLWTYSKPRGRMALSGDNTQTFDEFFRVLDFAEYINNASSPVIGRGDVTISQAGEAVSLATFPNIPGSMTLQDYGDLSGYYLCVYMVGRTTGLPYIKTASQPFSTTLAPSLTLEYNELPNQDFPNGTEYYLCLCDTMQTALDRPPAGARYLPLPCFKGDSIENYIGRITKQIGYDVTFSFDLLFGGNSAPVASSFTNPAPPSPNYFNAPPSPDPYGVIENENRYYFNAGNNTSLKIRFKITGGTDTIYGNRIYAKLSPSYYGSPTARQKVDVYKVVNGTVSRINTSEALSQNTVYIGCLYSDVLVLNSNNQRAGSVPATLKKIRPYLELFDGSGEDSVKIAGVTFGVCNQSF
ncbi:MAG: hypothetical protein IJP49_06155 [Bacteroidales bacterium]|nr:hypothetical protein [Bacteroidales bacterium]